jgi:hypothetical protein
MTDFSSGPALPGGAAIFLRATESGAGSVQVTRFATITAALSGIEAGVRVALDCGADDARFGDEEPTVIVMLQGAPNINRIGSRNAAMVALANNLCKRIEPLGELLTAHGPVTLFALRI